MKQCVLFVYINRPSATYYLFPRLYWWNEDLYKWIKKDRSYRWKTTKCQWPHTYNWISVKPYNTLHLTLNAPIFHSNFIHFNSGLKIPFFDSSSIKFLWTFVFHELFSLPISSVHLPYLDWILWAFNLLEIMN